MASHKMTETTRSVLVWCLVLFLLLGMINFVSFLYISQLAGGRPDGVDDGRYFLWTRLVPEPGGRTTEVSRFTYLWVLWQGRSVLITLPAELLAAYLVLRSRNWRKKAGKKREEKVSEKAPG